MPVAGEPSLGRINAHSIAPPHTLGSIKQCISRVEGNSALRHADLFADFSCDAPMSEGHIPILTGDCPGLIQDEPMALVQTDKSNVSLHGQYTRRIRTNCPGSELNFDIHKRVVHRDCDSIGRSPVAVLYIGRNTLH